MNTSALTEMSDLMRRQSISISRPLTPIREKTFKPLSQTQNIAINKSKFSVKLNKNFQKAVDIPKYTVNSRNAMLPYGHNTVYTCSMLVVKCRSTPST